MGQGCNSALEDCTLLAQALEGAGYEVQAGLATFEAKRAPQVRRPLSQLLPAMIAQNHRQHMPV
jgi:2-polyprenyl-6-methoxyphenol hydroxylase-like FAD-dependent oxidoreductase